MANLVALALSARRQRGAPARAAPDGMFFYLACLEADLARSDTHAYGLPKGGCPDGTRDAAADRLLSRSLTIVAEQAPSMVEPRTLRAARAAKPYCSDLRSVCLGS